MLHRRSVSSFVAVAGTALLLLCPTGCQRERPNEVMIAKNPVAGEPDLRGWIAYPEGKHPGGPVPLRYENAHLLVHPPSHAVELGDGRVAFKLSVSDDAEPGKTFTVIAGVGPEAVKSKLTVRPRDPSRSAPNPSYGVPVSVGVYPNPTGDQRVLHGWVETSAPATDFGDTVALDYIDADGNLIDPPSWTEEMESGSQIAYFTLDVDPSAAGSRFTVIAEGGDDPEEEVEISSRPE